jgi:P-type Ca2+ transporter type 2C
MATDFGSDSLPGLSEADVASRLKQHGYNELPSSKRRSFFATAWDVVREPMFLLLLACGTVYLLLGDVQEALMLLGFVFVVLGITLYQERKTERALEALRDLSSPRALVIRGGERKRIAGRDVVPDDILVLAEGDRVPADCVVLSCSHLSTDESLLSGESVPVRKVIWDGVREMSRPGGEDLPFVFSGTLVVQGHGIAQVRATGIHTEMGSIGKWKSDAWCDEWRHWDWPCAPSWSFSTASPAAIGSKAFWLGSRWPWRCCRKSFPSC